MSNIGNHIGDAKEYAYEKHSDLKYVNGYDDAEICAGAGSMGIEILEQVPKVDVVLVPVGGCGLIAGVSLAVKTLSPETEVSSRFTMPKLFCFVPCKPFPAFL